MLDNSTTDSDYACMALRQVMPCNLLDWCDVVILCNFYHISVIWCISPLCQEFWVIFCLYFCNILYNKDLSHEVVQLFSLILCLSISFPPSHWFAIFHHLFIMHSFFFYLSFLFIASKAPFIFSLYSTSLSVCYRVMASLSEFFLWIKLLGILFNLKRKIKQATKSIREITG